MIILGIETSCDETAESVCMDGKILSNIVGSQLIHSNFGGVVPEVASREHERLLNDLTVKAIDSAKISINAIDGIPVTNGPGLAGALLTGVSFAKGLAIGLGINIVPINHLEAHIIANLLDRDDINYPFLCLLVSGGHTQLWLIKKMDDYSGDVPFIDSEHPELVVVPYQLDTNDMKLWLNAGYTPDMWLKYAKDTFDTLYREGEQTQKMMSLGVHLRIIGRPGRIWAFDQFFEHIRNFDRIWMTTREKIAEHMR